MKKCSAVTCLTALDINTETEHEAYCVQYMKFCCLVLLFTVMNLMHSAC